MKRPRGLLLLSGFIASGIGVTVLAAMPGAAPARRPGVVARTYQADPLWPKPLPNGWTLGPVSGIRVSSDDHVWVEHRGGECCAFAPPVLEFDQAGQLQRVDRTAASIEPEAPDAPRAVDSHGNVYLAEPVYGRLRRLKYAGLGRVQSPSSSYARPELLVETAWLSAHLNDANVRVVDMRARGFTEGHIPGAVPLSSNAIKIQTNAPTFLPAPDEFERLMAGLGISNATRVIVYDDRGGIYAARLWFVLNAFGHTNVALLNGGWTKWTAEQRASAAGVAEVHPTTFRATVMPRWVATAADVVAAIDKPKTKIVDARTPGEIAGTDLRGIKRGGAIPSAVPVYWEDALNTTTRAFKSQDEIAKIFADRGITADDEVITYCQVGMRASHDLFSLALSGHPLNKLRVYYGSWEEWGNRDDLPIIKK